MRPQNWVYTIPLRVRSLFKRSAADNELNEELQYHLDQKTQEFISKGLGEKEAHYASLREFDGLQQSKENCRDARKVNWIQDFAQDLRFGARMLRKNLGFTAVAILTLAIGIGANTAIFSVVHAVLIKSLPYPNADRLAIIWSAWGNEPRGPASGPEVAELCKRSKLFEEIAGIWVTTGTIAGEGEPEQVRFAQVTANFMPLVAAQPQLGRFFSADEDRAGGPPAMIITDGLWRRQYGADASIVGKRVRVGNAEFTLVGVMPRNFRLIFPDDSNVPPDVDVFTTLRGDLAKFSRTTGYIRILGRLQAGATFAQAQHEADGIATQLRAAYKDFGDQNLRMHVVSLQADDVRNVRHSLLTLFGGVGLVLLIACVNVANLLLARATGRTREITVRTALGASATRIVRQMLTESVLLSAAGGALALAVGWGALRWLLSLRPDGIARIGYIGLDTSVFAFTAAVAIIAGIIFGLVPALAAAKLNLLHSLNAEGRSSTGGKPTFRNFLLISEVALGFVLVVASGLTIRAFTQLLRVDPGFREENALTFQLSVPGKLFATPHAAENFLHDLKTNISAIPGVESVGVISHLPLDAGLPNWYSYYWPDGASQQDQNTVMADYRSTSPGYFQSIGATLISGRDFTDFDDATHTHVAIVDDALAQQTWPNQDPIGKKLNVEDSPGGPFNFVRDGVIIIGVVRHVQYHSLTKNVRAQIYLPYALAPRPQVSFVVSTSTPLASLVTPIRKVVSAANKNLPVSHIMPLADYVRLARSDTRFITMLSGVLAGIALLLACIGIYGVTSYSVIQRTRQIGVHIALGAQPSDVLKIVMREGLTLIAVGLFAGLVLYFALTPLLSSLLEGVRPADALSITGAFFVLLIAGASACYIPARRATRVDPIIALRYE